MGKKHCKNHVATKHVIRGRGNGDGKPFARSVGASVIEGRFKSGCNCTGCVHNLGTDGEGVNMSVFCGNVHAYLYLPSQECMDFVQERQLEASDESNETVEAFA